MTDSQNTHDQITKGRRLRCLWSNCSLCTPFILSRSQNKCWLHTGVLKTCRCVASLQTCRPGPTNFRFYHSTAWKIKGCLRLTCGLVEEQLLIFSSCLPPGRVKNLQKFTNFCLKVGHSPKLKHSKSTWRPWSCDSCEMYKISTSRNGNNLQQLSFWYQVLSCGAKWFTKDVYIWVTHLHINSAQNNLFLMLRVTHKLENNALLGRAKKLKSSQCWWGQCVLVMCAISGYVEMKVSQTYN